MKHLRKDNHCLNCNLKVESIYNYCPQCGQENTNNKVSILELLRDLYDDYMTFDSRFFKSLKPFILQPGALTNAFNQGHRIKYVHPVRFYLLISLVYFFVFTHVFDFENLPFNRLGHRMSQADSLNNDSITQSSVAKLAVLLKLKAKLKKLEKSQKNIEKDISEDSTENDIEDIQDLDIIKAQIKYLKPIIINFEDNKDTLINVKKVEAELSKIEDPAEVLSINFSGKRRELTSFVQLERWVQDKNMTEKAFLDSIGEKEHDEWKIKLAKQTLKIGRNDLSIFLQSTINNIPIMMILLLPIMAFFLKIIYIRSKKLYIEHLVFAFHIQSFIYLVFSLFLILFYLFSYQNPKYFIICLSVILTIYVIAMFRNVYKQSILKTIIKSAILSYTYTIALFLFLVLEIFISFWLY